MAIQLFSASGYTDNGTLHIRNRRKWDRVVSAFRRAEVVVTIERRHAIRSQLQSRYYFGVVLHLLSEHTGYTVDELHEWAKAKFLPKHLSFADGNGEVVDEHVVGGSTRKLNKLQFGEYVEAIRKFSAESLDVDIPDPDPLYKERQASHG